MRIRVSSLALVSSEKQDQLSQGQQKIGRLSMAFCCWIIDPNMALNSILGSSGILVPSGSIGSSDVYDFSCTTTPGHHHGHRRLTRSQISTWHSVATGTTDVSSDPGCCRMTDQYLALCNSMSPNDTMGLGGSTRRSDLYDSGCRMTLKLQQAVTHTLGCHVAFSHQQNFLRQFFSREFIFMCQFDNQD